MFIDQNSSIDKHALRSYVYNELTKTKAQVESLLIKHHTFWQNLHHVIVSNPEFKEEHLRVEEELLTLPKYIDNWIETALDSEERLDFFISAKAEEIRSGDQFRDYFWALQVRHDQLVALVKVLTTLIDHLNRWSTMLPEDVIADPVWKGLLDYSIDKQIYLEAENIHKKRSIHLN